LADNGDKTVKIPTFDGQKKNFVMWWTRFKAYAKEKKFSEALRPKPEDNLPSSQKALNRLDVNDKTNLAALQAAATNDRALYPWASRLSLVAPN
jgi:hypothetical protein